MRAFGIFSIAAAAALSLLPSAFAAPLGAEVGAVAGVAAVVGREVAAVAGAGAAAGAVVARDAGSCVGILADVKVDLAVHIDALGCLNKANATEATITPILSAVVEVIADAVVKIKALDGCTDTAYECACALADILVVICTALGVLLTVVADVQILLSVIVKVALGGCLCELISALLAIVDGLLLELVPLVLGLAGVLISLGLDVVGQLLAIC